MQERRRKGYAWGRIKEHDRVVLTDKPGATREGRHMTDDPSWFTGPPYAVVEEVFDEDSMQDCSPDPEEG